MLVMATPVVTFTAPDCREEGADDVKRDDDGFDLNTLLGMEDREGAEVEGGVSIPAEVESSRALNLRLVLIALAASSVSFGPPPPVLSVSIGPPPPVSSVPSAEALKAVKAWRPLAPALGKMACTLS
jgi:hypothetical protein